MQDVSVSLYFESQVMEYYNGVPINNTEEHRKFIKFREAKPKQKTKQKNFRLDKRRWLEYDSYADKLKSG